MVVFFELHAGPNDALLKSKRLLSHKIITELRQLLGLLARMFERCLEIIGFGEVSIDAKNRGDEKVVELVSCPLRKCQ